MIALCAAIFLVALGGSASAAESPPVNVKPPTITPTAPHVGFALTASKGEWTSQAPSYWYDGTTKMAEGKSVALTTPEGSVTLKFKLGGANTEVVCNTKWTEASVENPAGGAPGIGKANLTLSGCTTNIPKCTVVNGAAVPVNLALVEYGGKTDVAITPQKGTTLATWTFSGTSCALKGIVFPLTGVLRGTFSDSKSAVEYGADTVAGGELLVGSNPVLEAGGAVAVRTSAGHTVAADNVSYEYAWTRCAELCTTIATGPSYTPTAAEVGGSLYVIVTATNKYGSSSKTVGVGPITHSLYWYACKEGGGGGYADSNCTKAEAKGPFSWQRLSSSSAKGGSGPLELRWKVEGGTIGVTCSSGTSTGTLTNPESGAKIERYEDHAFGCVGSQPGCQVKGGEIAFGPLTGAAPDVATKEVAPSINLTAEETWLLKFEMVGCGFEFYNGRYRASGSIPTTVSGNTLWSSEGTHGSIFLQKEVGPSYPATLDAGFYLNSEGKYPVKLGPQV
jgi:hypothetical protein